MEPKLGVKTYLKAIVKSVSDLGNGIIEAVVATDSLDRHGEHLDINGIDLKQYKKNPVVLWGHLYDQPPIGKALELRKEVATDGTNQLIAKIQFAIDEYPFAHLIYKLFNGGYMNAFSIGFIPSDLKESDEGNIVWTKSEMIEFSAVPVPANPEALALAKSFGFESIEDIKVIKAIEAKTETEEKPAETTEPAPEVEAVEKTGRVLSAKNEDLVKAAIDALGGAKNALQAVLDANNSEKAADNTQVNLIDIVKKSVSATETLLSQATDATNVKKKKILMVRAKKAAQITDKSVELIINGINKRLN